jgi:DNA-binding NarL/FixJ family response regulator
VILADNGWTGLQLYRQEHPDVILLDLKIDEVPPSPPRGSGRFVRWSAP